MNKFSNLVQASIIRIKSIIQVKKDNQNLENSDYTFPLELFEDRNENTKLLMKRAKRHALSKERDIMNILSSENIKVSAKDSPFVGHTSIQYRYKISDYNERMPNLFEIESKIESQLDIYHIRVELVSGSLQITIPLPSKFQISIDTRKLVESTY